MACDGRVWSGLYIALVSWDEFRCMGGKVLSRGVCVYLCVCNDILEDMIVRNENEDTDYDENGHYVNEMKNNRIIIRIRNKMKGIMIIMTKIMGMIKLIKVIIITVLK